MNLTKRKLLAILSLELLLYSFLYFPTLLVIGLAISISEPIDPAQRLGLLAVAVATTPFAWLALNAWIAAALVKKGPFSERNWRTMRFGLIMMGCQVLLALLAFPLVRVFGGIEGSMWAIGGLAAAGLAAAALMKSEKD